MRNSVVCTLIVWVVVGLLTCGHMIGLTLEIKVNGITPYVKFCFAMYAVWLPILGVSLFEIVNTMTVGEEK